MEVRQFVDGSPIDSWLMILGGWAGPPGEAIPGELRH